MLNILAYNPIIWQLGCRCKSFYLVHFSNHAVIFASDFKLVFDVSSLDKLKENLNFTHLKLFKDAFL